MIRWLLLAILVAGIALAVGEWVRLRGRSSRTAVSTAPARRSRAFDTVEEGLELDDANRGSYEVAFERGRQLDESALTMWLQRVARLPRLSREQFNDLDRPSVKNIMRRPRRYAGQAISLKVYPVRAWRWTANEDFTATRWWTVHDGPVWRIGCLNADAADPAQEPIFVLFTSDPRTVLGPPKRVGERDELLYPQRRAYRLAGVFYKLYQVRDRDGTMRRYPVLLVWQMDRVGGPGGIGDGEGGFLGRLRYAIIIMLLLGFGFIFLKHRARRAAGGDLAGSRRDGRQAGRPGARYRPLRVEGPETQPAGEGPAGTPAAQGDEDEPEIDPKLKAALEQYRREKGLDDAADNNRPTR